MILPFRAIDQALSVHCRLDGQDGQDGQDEICLVSSNLVCKVY